MTSLPSATSIPDPRNVGQTFLSVSGRGTPRPDSVHARGFTLIQVLVAIGIIVLLVSMLLPAINRAREQARRTAVAMNLQAISTALEAYKQDFGDYPRLPVTASRSTTYDYGSMLLCRALIGPAPAATDGADGNGFRVRTGGAGRVYGPYLDPSKFRIAKAGDDNTWEIRDGNKVDNPNDPLVSQYGSPILYYPARPARPDITVKPSTYTGSFAYPYLVSGDDTQLGNNSGDLALFNINDNKDSAGNPRLTHLQLLLAVEPNYLVSGNPSSYANVFPAGTKRPNWAPTGGTFTGPYLLWTAGPDGYFGATDNTTGKERVSTDDVNNITQ